MAAPPIKSLAGVYPPITTPFDAGGEVDYAALKANVTRWNAYDLGGYVVLGSNGEAALLSEREKLRVLETVRRATAPGKLVIAGTGAESTRATISLTRQTAEAGADAVLVITPCFFDAAMTDGALVHHYRAVADASPLPVVLYNVPKFTHVDMAASTIARAGEHPNVIGVKDSSGNITKLADTVRLSPPGFQVLAGSAGVFYPALAVGAVGGVLALANIAPQQCIDIWKLHAAGDHAGAAALQRRMVPVNAAITARYGVPGLKAALDMLGWRGGPVRSPLVELDEMARVDLRRTLIEGGVLEA